MPACYLDLSKLGKTSWMFPLAHIGTQNEAGWWLGALLLHLGWRPERMHDLLPSPP